MTIDKDQTEPIETYLWHGIIDVTTGILSDGVYSLSGLRLQMHRNPSLLQGADLVYVPYAASLWREDDLILIVSVEQEDYRAIAHSLGCPVREIQEEKKTRAFFGSPRIIAYAGAKREDLEPFEGELEYAAVKDALFEWVCDIIETMDDPVKST